MASERRSSANRPSTEGRRSLARENEVEVRVLAAVLGRGQVVHDESPCGLIERGIGPEAIVVGLSRCEILVLDHRNECEVGRGSGVRHVLTPSGLGSRATIRAIPCATNACLHVGQADGAKLLLSVARI